MCCDLKVIFCFKISKHEQMFFVKYALSAIDVRKLYKVQELQMYMSSLAYMGLSGVGFF